MKNKKILCLFLTTIIIGASILHINSNTISANETSPKELEIQEKKYVKLLLGNTSSPEELQSKLKKLNKEELILAISEISDYLELKNSPTDMMIFAPVVENLAYTFSEDDYIKILEDDNNSDLMKMFFIDMYSYESTNSKMKKGNHFNNKLRNIVKDSVSSEKLKLFSITNIDNLNASDIPFLKEILENPNASENIKGFSLDYYTKLDPKSATDLQIKILDNFEKYSEREVVTSMRNISKLYAPNSKKSQIQLESNSQAKNDFILQLNKVVKNTNSRLLKDGVAFSLGDLRSPESIATLLENKTYIDDNSILKDVIDQNYLTIKEMLTNEYKDIALECIDIMPMKDFMEDLELIENESLYKIETKSNTLQEKTKINSLKNKINSNEFKHNTKWDLN